MENKAHAFAAGMFVLLVTAMLVVLAAFILGVALGVLGMVPRWWKHRRLATQARSDTPPATTNTELNSANSADTPHGI